MSPVSTISPESTSELPLFNFKKASSNLPRVSALNCAGINVKDIILYDKIFIEEQCISKINERLA